MRAQNGPGPRAEAATPIDPTPPWHGHPGREKAAVPIDPTNARSWLWLASASPRRRELLLDHGFTVRCVPANLDDAAVPPRGNPPARWAMAMAWFKAAQVRATAIQGEPGGIGDGAVRWILAADTVCDLDGRIVGKPRSAEECREILRQFVGRSHRTCTGVCLLDAVGGAREIFVDVVDVHLGPVDGASLDRYVSSGAWQGKAGGYNFAEQVAAGWPLQCDGDPTSVMGLPMRRLAPRLEGLRSSHGGLPSGAARSDAR